LAIKFDFLKSEILELLLNFNMLTSNPIYLVYDDSDQYCVPSSYEQQRRHYQQMKRREAERRAEIYRLYQMKEEEDRRKKYALMQLAKEEEENRRRVAMLRQQEEEHRRQLAMHRQHRQEQELLRRKTAAFQRSQKRQKDEQEEEEEEKNWTIVRGNDGRLHKISLNNPSDDTESDSDATEPTSNTWNETQSTAISKPVIDQQFLPVPPELPQKSSLPRGRVTVVVEDASDDESDHESLKSVWRNRRPSPGQWMEPIDNTPH
jgi:hypothetical protein